MNKAKITLLQTNLTAQMVTQTPPFLRLRASFPMSTDFFTPSPEITTTECQFDRLRKMTR